MDTYAKLKEFEARLRDLEAKVFPITEQGVVVPDTIESEALANAAVEMREAADAILDASKPRRKK